MYQIFEITLNPKEIDLEKKLKVNKVNWHSNGQILTKDDDGLQYILDLTAFKLKCVMPELFPIDEGDWVPEDNPSREEIVKTAITELNKLPFSLEVTEIRRTVKHE